MKNRTNQLFPIITMSVLAALTFYLQQAVQFSSPESDAKYRHDPDAKAENFRITRFDENGHLKYRIYSPFGQHYPDHDSTLMRSPVIMNYQPEKPVMTLAARNGLTVGSGDVVFLWQEVTAHRPAMQDTPALSAFMDDLVALPDQQFGFTQGPAEIRQGYSWLKGVGMEIDQIAATFVLQSQVKGLYFSPKKQP